MLVARRASCREANVFSTRLKLIRRDPASKPPKCPKMHFWQKAPGLNGLKQVSFLLIFVIRENEI